jgi:glutamine synthetase
MYLGDDMTNYLKSYMSGQAAEYKPATKVISPAKGVAKVEIPAQDRNRSSPFPYGGNRFEFRAVGSSQNVGLVNTVLMAIVAQAFKEFSDEIEKGKSAKEVAQNALKDSFKVIFNGNGYDAANQQMLTDMGLWRIDSGVDAIARFTEPKNVKLFGDLGIFTPEECKARKTVMLNHYVGMVEMEALSMIDMLQQHIIPSVNVSKVAGEKELTTFVATLKSELHAMHEEKDEVLRATKARNLRLETMIRIRTFVDEVEGTVPAKNWTLATYKDLVSFLSPPTPLSNLFLTSLSPNLTHATAVVPRPGGRQLLVILTEQGP